MNNLNKFGLFSNRNIWQNAATLGLSIAFLLTATPAFAHHALGGRTPANFGEGFLSGLAHPIIGLDHFAIVISVGLLAVIYRQGILIPIAFIASAMFGTIAHLSGIEIPGIELFVTGSIVLFGIVLVKSNRFNIKLVAGLGAIAGLLHGYAYGEAIFGAEMTPLLAYLIGFTVIQLVVSLAAFGIAKALISSQKPEPRSSKLHNAGFVICGIGLAFFTSQLMAVLLPLLKS